MLSIDGKFWNTMAFYTTYFCATMHIMVTVHAFLPPPPSDFRASFMRIKDITTWRLYTEIEDAAENLHFANVGIKDHLGPDFPSRSLDLGEEETSTGTAVTEQRTAEHDTTPVQKNDAERNVSSKEGKEKGAGKNKIKGTKVTKQNRNKNFKTANHPISELKLGSKIQGRVAAFTDFGVLIKINYDLKKRKGNNGYALLHKSQIRDEFVENPATLFRIGSILKDLRVITIDYEKGNVGLSLRSQRPKRKSASEFEIEKEYKGKIYKVVSYGAFVDVGAQSNALLHISRISQKKIDNISDWVNEGDDVTVRIIKKDVKNNKMAASMLDPQADEYLDRRSAQLERLRKKSNEANEKKSELEYFEEAVKELEDALEKS